MGHLQKKDVVGARKATAEDAARVQSLAAQLSDSFTASAALRRRVDRQQQQMDSIQGLLESIQELKAGGGGGSSYRGEGSQVLHIDLSIVWQRLTLTRCPIPSLHAFLKAFEQA